jgi:hypothetical protein
LERIVSNRLQIPRCQCSFVGMRVGHWGLLKSNICLIWPPHTQCQWGRHNFVKVPA